MPATCEKGDASVSSTTLRKAADAAISHPLVVVNMRTFALMLESAPVVEYIQRFKTCRPQLHHSGAVTFEEMPELPCIWGRLDGYRKGTHLDTTQLSWIVEAFSTRVSKTANSHASPDVCATHISLFTFTFPSLLFFAPKECCTQ